MKMGLLTNENSPGRWYASFALKHILVHLLKNYDLELVNKDAPRFHIWTTAIVPRSDVYITLKVREAGSIET
jgi:hypothetical protein